jgi:FkbM family methyltransferase
LITHFDSLARYLKVKFLGSVTARLFFGRSVIVRADSKDDSDARTLIQFGMIPSNGEIKTTRFLIKTLKETDVFYDVGANFGFYTYLALEFCKEVHAFEPLLYAYSSMHESLKGDSRAHLNQLALAGSNGESVLYKKTNHSGGSSLVDKDKSNAGALPIQTITLDTYVLAHTIPTIIKIDVEGAEELVLKGGSEFLSAQSPIVIMEIWSYEVRKELFPRVLQAISLLKSYGYTAYELMIDGTYSLYEGDYKLPGESGDAWGDNYLFIKGTELFG